VKEKQGSGVGGARVTIGEVHAQQPVVRGWRMYKEGGSG